MSSTGNAALDAALLEANSLEAAGQGYLLILTVLGENVSVRCGLLKQGRGWIKVEVWAPAAGPLKDVPPVFIATDKIVSAAIEW